MKEDKARQLIKDIMSNTQGHSRYSLKEVARSCDVAPGTMNRFIHGQKVHNQSALKILAGIKQILGIREDTT